METEVKGSPLEKRIDEESYRGVIKEAEDELQSFVVEDGVVMPMDAFIITAEKS
ncbi:MAG TPA: hypothetical protein VFH16_08125 [Rubrobacter sp.]|nr:hypothetical protein [Rubrobacter sp.]